MAGDCRLKFDSCSVRVTDLWMKGPAGVGVILDCGVIGMAGTDSSFGSFDVAISVAERGVTCYI